MKPTIPLHKHRPHSPKIESNYQVASMPSRGGRRRDSRRASIRAVSHEYFKKEARSIYATEAAFFGVIVLTAAVPLINAAIALGHLVRSFAVL